MATTTPPEAGMRLETRHSGSGSDRAFERWGITAHLVAVAMLVGAVLVFLGGDFAYVLDDAAIHLSVADTLVQHGTWGVSAGSFESASSSPLWTLLVAVGLVVTPSAAEQWVPLILNAAAGVAVVMILARGQTTVVPDRRRPLDAAATVILVVVALFLPGLAVVGMEHTLHVALILGAVVLVQRRISGEIGAERLPGWVPYVLLALAALTRFETAFVAVGLAAGMAIYDGVGWQHLRARQRQVAGVLLSAAVPIALFGLWNNAMGGGWLPNSVLGKGQGIGSGNNQSDGTGPVDIGERLTQDALLATVFALAVGYLVLTWGRGGRHRLVAMTLAVAAPLHAALADIGWYERYQAYLIAVGVYFVLGVIAELPADQRRRALAVFVVVAVAFSPLRARDLLWTAKAADDMYRQQYQAGLFLERYYDGVPVATDQLGYISLFHDGPLTDFAGLGDYEVLRERPGTLDELRVHWQELTEERGFRVAVLYDKAGWAAPRSWVLAGQLVLEGRAFTGVSRRLQFWAATPDEVRPLQEHLQEFEAELPDRLSLDLNEFAGFQADAREAEEASG